jgi:DNA polymerase-3 subunit epsilon
METSLAALLSTTRPIVCLDCETTGLDVQTCRIVEIGFQVWYHDGTPLKEWSTLVNPLVPISAEVSAIHGITDEKVRGCQICGRSKTEHEAINNGPRPESLLTVNDGQPIVVQGLAVDHSFKPWPTFKQLAPSLAKGFTNCDYAGKNTRFDLRILDAEFRRVGQPWSYTGAQILDAGRLEQLAEPRELSHLYKKYTGQEHDGAHGALADVRAVSVVIAAQLARYEALPKDIEALHTAQWPGWLTSDGSFRMVNGVPTCNFGKHRDKAMKDVPNDYYDYILKQSFPADVKALASKAKLGEYPQ